MNRRDLLLATVAATNLSPAAAQTAPTADDLELTRRAIQANREAMAKVKLPMAVEPAFQFKA